LVGGTEIVALDAAEIKTTVSAMSRALITILLLIGSNCFMTWAWYGHLKKVGWALPVAIGVSWLIALPEYLLQVPANRIGHFAYGGPFSAAQLKIIQEAITLVVFLMFAVLVLKEKPRVNEMVAMGLIFAAVIVAMMGRPPMVNHSTDDGTTQDLSSPSSSSAP
jgi:uncharacterized protein (DUF486 family)